MVKNAEGHCSLGAAPVLRWGRERGQLSTASFPDFPEMPGVLVQEGEAIVTTQDENQQEPFSTRVAAMEWSYFHSALRPGSATEGSGVCMGQEGVCWVGVWGPSPSGGAVGCIECV